MPAVAQIYSTHFATTPRPNYLLSHLSIEEGSQKDKELTNKYHLALSGELSLAANTLET